MFSHRKGWLGRRLAHAAIAGVMAAPMLALSTGAFLAPAHAESSTTVMNAVNDEQFSMYVAAGENVKWVVRLVDDTTGHPNANYTLTLTDASGAVVGTCSILASHNVGRTCTLTGTATAANAGVWQARIDADVISFNPVGDPAPSSNDQQVQHLSWDLNVRTGTTNIPGRVWIDDYYTGAISQGDGSAADLASNAKDIELYYLDDAGWLYKGTYTDYNGVYSRLYSNRLGLINDSTGLPQYMSVDLADADHVGGPGNPSYKIFFDTPDASMPTTATWPDGTTRPLNNSGAPIMPAVSNFSFARSGTTSDAGTFTYDITDYTGVVKVVVDTDNSGAPSAGDVTLSDMYDGVTGSVAWDGKDAGGSNVPVTRDVKAWVQVDRTGEIHFLNQDVELRGSIEVQRLNGPAAGRSTLYWNDTGLVVDTSHHPAPAVLDGTTGVDSTGGVHGLPASPGTTSNDGMFGWGNTRVIEDWTYVPINLSTLATIPGLGADVKIVKELVSTGPFMPGDAVDWRITVSNVETATATEVVVEDVQQSGVTVDSLDSASKGSVSGMSWNVGSLASGETATVMVHGTLDSDASGTVNNLATVTAAEDPYTGDSTVAGTQDNTDVAGDTDNGDFVPLTVDAAPLPDLRILKERVGTGPVKRGDTVTYRISARNNGPGAATNVVASELAPAGLNNVSLSSPSAGTVSGSDWTIGNLAANTTETVTVTGTVASDMTGTLTNTATITSTEDPYSGTPTACQDNTDLAGDADQCDVVDIPIVVDPPDLRILKVNNGAGPVKPGQAVSFTVSVQNMGEADATNTVADDLAPASLTGVALSNPSLGTTSGTSWNIGTLPSGQIATVTVTGNVAAGATGSIVNTATVTSTEDPYTGSPSACQDNTDLAGDSDQCDLVRVPLSKPDLRIVKTRVGTASVTGGDTITWQVDIANQGIVDADNVVVTDTAPSEVPDAAFSAPSAGTATGLTWNVGTLAAGATAHVTVTGTVADDAKGPLVNVAIVDSPDDPATGDPEDCQDNTTLNTDTDQCDPISTPIAGPDLRIDKSGKAGKDGVVTWTVKVTNLGPGRARDVVVADFVPDSAIEGSTKVVTAPTMGTFDSESGTWNVGRMVKGDEATLVFSTKHTSEALAKGVENVALVDSPDDPWVPSENCQVNTDLAGDNDQCDSADVVVKQPPVIDSGVPMLADTASAFLAGLLAVVGGFVAAGVAVTRRRKLQNQ
jgi:uncharacterized repeat protein (TIGR01451 family)